MSKIEVNQISSQCGSTLTIGQSGDTVTLACGASQTGFGRTGTVDWNTTAITADPANAVSGTGYFANTTSAAFTITLPTSPSAGDIVAVRDYAQTFATNNLTIGRNGQPIDGGAFDLVLSTNGAAVTLVYVDGTQGWKSVNSNETINEQLYVAATGGTIITCGDYKIHVFTGPGTFCVSCAGNPSGSNTVDYLVVAGGGGGGDTGGCSNNRPGGGGGAGGWRASDGTASGCYSAGPAPLVGCVSALPITVQGYPISVGSGGAKCTSGNNSIFSTITSAAGGAGGRGQNPAGSPPGVGSNGGSGGGAGADVSSGSVSGGLGNTPPVSPPQGNNGGDSTLSPLRGGGGGGGATVAGTDGNSCHNGGGDGGDGAASAIAPSCYGETSGCQQYYAGGGGGGTNSPGVPVGTGGLGGGGIGAIGTTCAAATGTANTGGGGGAGGSAPQTGKAGGSGIVIIRYKYQ